MIKPRKLEKGDTIALIAPSGGLGGLVPHRIDNAVNSLIALGYKVKEFPTTRKFTEGSSDTPESRVNDIHAAFKDSEIKAIICTIGGLSSNELLNLIDYNLIKNNPKIFIGYSDISILHYAFHVKSNLVTFYGPAAMTQFGENPTPLAYTVEYFNKALTSNQPIGEVVQSKKWTDETLDWFQKKDTERSRKLKTNLGYTWLSNGKASGKIIGGCLPSILQLKGTSFNVDYSDKIIFLEIPEGQDFTKGEPVAYVDSQIMDLKNSGAFKKIKGLIFGRGFGYSDEETEKLKKIVLKHTKDLNIPVVYNVNVGHTDPIITIPLGVQVTLDSSKDLFSIDEAGVLN